MKSPEWYKERFPDPRGVEELTLHKNGQVDIPFWLLMYIMKASGVRSKKSRIIKKTIKRGLNKLLNN